MKHLNLRNPNADVFVVPQEEGGVEDDNYYGSIGDATMRHVQSLSGAERQLWEELIHVKSGAIFRTTPSTETNDKDPFNLKGKDLKEYLAKYEGKVSAKALEAIKEAIDVERQRQEASEDALDRAELIPYSEWEQNPQMWNSTDIPSTPKDKFQFMGNTTQPFYDEFPEGHPDQHYINQIVQRCDREWCGSTDDIKYGAWLKAQLNEANLKLHTKKFLSQMIDKLVTAEQEADEVVSTHLGYIDSFFSDRYREFALRKAKTPIRTLLQKQEKDWEQKFAQGNIVLPEVRKFGKTIYSDLELRGQMTNSLWNYYESLKNKFAPRLMLGNVDLNRCSVQVLRKTLHLTDKEARQFWLNRPYQSVYQEDVAKYLNMASKHHTENPVVNKILDGLEQQFKVGVEKKSLTPLTSARQKMNNWQQKGSFNLSATEWNGLWNYFRILKDSTIKVLKNEQNSQEGSEENV